MYAELRKGVSGVSETDADAALPQICFPLNMSRLCSVIMNKQ